jgi:hypothetical protein
MIALSILFVGEEKTKTIFDSIGFETIFCIRKSPTLEVSFEEHVLYGVVSGIAAMKQNKYVENENHKFDNEKAEKTAGKLAMVFIRKLENNYGKIPSFLECDHNGAVITALEREIAANAPHICEEASFIYHIAINSLMDIETAMKGSREEIERVPSGYYHAFILEQYQSSEQNNFLVRFHQTWLDQFGLQEHYEMIGFDDADQGCFDQDRLKVFFRDLRCLFLTPTSEYQQRCFNVDQDVLSPITFRFEAGIYFGLSFRYVTTRVKPRDCLGHLQKFQEVHSCGPIRQLFHTSDCN